MPNELRKLRFNVPELKYRGKKTKPVSFRLPAELVRQLEITASRLGYSRTDLVALVLDQALQQLAQTRIGR